MKIYKLITEFAGQDKPEELIYSNEPAARNTFEKKTKESGCRESSIFIYTENGDTGLLEQGDRIAHFFHDMPEEVILEVWADDDMSADEPSMIILAKGASQEEALSTALKFANDQAYEYEYEAMDIPMSLEGVKEAWKNILEEGDCELPDSDVLSAEEVSEASWECIVSDYMDFHNGKERAVCLYGDEAFIFAKAIIEA